MTTDAEILAAFKQHGSKRAAAAALGMERSSFRTRLSKIDPATERPPNAPNGVVSYKLGGGAQDREVVRLRDENQRLRGEIQQQHRTAIDEETVLGLIGRIADTPEHPPEWLVEPKGGPGSNEVPMTSFTDWHLGETVSLAETNGINEYDPEIAGRRVKNLVTSVVDLCRNHHGKNYPGIVLNLLGDFVSGGLHPELEKTDSEEAIPAALRARDLLVWAIEALADEFGRVFVPCVAGNHGRTTRKPEHKRYVFKNFDWLIYQLLARHFEGEKDVHFVVPPSNEVLYRVFGHRFLAMHGDMLGVKGGDGIIGALGPILRGEMKVSKQYSVIGRDYDTLLIGHWHQEIPLPRVLVSNALKGWDEYAKNVLRAPPSEPSQPLWFQHPTRGRTSYWNVTVDAPRERKSAEWVSVLAA